MTYICKQCGNKTMTYSGGANQIHTGTQPGHYSLTCANCGNIETHSFREPMTIQESLGLRQLQDF